LRKRKKKNNNNNNNSSKERKKITLIKIVKIYISIKNVTKNMTYDRIEWQKRMHVVDLD